jgi:hypothetical protein
MRAAWLILLAACAQQPLPPGVAQIIPLDCDRSVAEACAQSGCDRTLDAAQHDQNLCGPGFPAAVYSCDGYMHVDKSGVDAGTAWYYKDGNLVAMISRNAVAVRSCVAGPSSFDLPLCNGDIGTPIVACR